MQIALPGRWSAHYLWTRWAKSAVPADESTELKVLVLAPNSWAGQWVNRQQLFSRLGVHLHVLYSTGGWFTWDRSDPAWQQARWSGRFMRHDNVWVDESPRVLLRAPRLGVFDDLMLRLQISRWRRFLRSLGNGPVVAYIFHPMFLPYVKGLRADLLVYHAYDLYQHTPGWTEELERAERELLRQAGLVVAASEQIARVLRTKVNREVRVLPNGADVDAFTRAASLACPPTDLACIPHPRLGWVGSLHPQVDYGLVAELARRRNDWHFVLVGNIVATADARAEAEMAACRELANVHFLGAKPVDAIANYLIYMDVNLMFYRLAEESWIMSGYPLKLHEYLAAGQPVVSVDLPSVRPFSHVVQIANGPDEWQEAIEMALSQGGRGSRHDRVAVAGENSWSNRVTTLRAWLTSLISATKSEN